MSTSITPRQALRHLRLSLDSIDPATLTAQGRLDLGKAREAADVLSDHHRDPLNVRVVRELDPNPTALIALRWVFTVAAFVLFWAAWAFDGWEALVVLTASALCGALAGVIPELPLRTSDSGAGPGSTREASDQPA